MFVCGVPKDSGEFSRLLCVERRLFGDLSLSSAMADSIFRFRPEIYSAILGQGESVAAYTSAFPLKPEWADAFIAGDVTEPDLTPGMLLGRHDCLEGARVYIGSVVIDSACNPLMKSTLLASLVAWRVRQMRAASVKRLSVMMTAVTKRGERMIRSVGARQLNDGANRKDGHAIYGREITPGFLGRVTAAMERCLNSGLVQMDFDFRPGVQAVGCD